MSYDYYVWKVNSRETGCYQRVASNHITWKLSERKNCGQKVHNQQGLKACLGKKLLWKSDLCVYHIVLASSSIHQYPKWLVINAQGFFFCCCCFIFIFLFITRLIYYKFTSTTLAEQTLNPCYNFSTTVLPSTQLPLIHLQKETTFSKCFWPPFYCKYEMRQN